MRKLEENEYLGWRVKKRYTLHEIAALCINVSPMDIWSSGSNKKIKVTSVSGSMEAIIQALIEDIKKGKIAWSSVNLIDGFGKEVDKGRLQDLSTVMTKRDIELDTFYNQGLNAEQKPRAINPLLSTIEKKAVLDWCIKQEISPPVFLKEIQSYVNPEDEDKKPSKYRRHRERCGLLAQYMWHIEPEAKIEHLIDRGEMIWLACEEKKYTPKTLRKWIKEFAPSDKGGRPTKKK